MWPNKWVSVPKEIWIIWETKNYDNVFSKGGTSTIAYKCSGFNIYFNSN